MRCSKFTTLIIVIFISCYLLFAAHESNILIQSETEESLSVQALRCEYKKDPIGIDVLKPRLSWQIRSSQRGIMQTAYQIQIALQQPDLNSGENLLWDTGRVESDQSLYLEYNGPPLESSKRYYWQVRIWDEDSRASGWSSPAVFEMGLLSEEDWQAKWIQPSIEEDTSKSQPSPMLRTDFEIAKEIKSARIYATSLGVYEVELNGQRIGDQVLTPGWTSYKNQLQYQTYDVGEFLTTGSNAIGVMLGDGWYRGNIGFENQRNYYGEKLALLLQINIEYIDGQTQIVTSNNNWKADTGPILVSDIYNGETYDARLEKPDWSKPGYDSTGWTAVTEITYPKNHLIAPPGPPIRKIEEIKPTKIIQTPKGETVFDLGQNMVGWIRLSIQGETGTEITLRHAEVLDKEGNFYTDNLRAAAQTVKYTLKGKGLEVYEPRFTFQGFRFVSVDGFPGEPQLDQITGVVVHSDMESTGEFECSDPLINQLQHNIEWGQKGNFLDVPTDCPQRDERLGWTGDAQVFARTAAFNKGVAGFFSKWLRDLAADQAEDGSIPHVIPDVIGGGASAGWADAGVIIPWTMYQNYGDKRFLRDQYSSMKAWIEYQRKTAGESHLWNTGFHFGDWLAYATTRSDYPGATTDKDLIATAFFGYSTSLLVKSAKVLGYTEDVAIYSALLSRIKVAFNQEFVTPQGRLASNTQTAYALALNFDLLPEDKRGQAATRLAKDIKGFGNHLTTGFLGTPYLCHVLSRFGHLETAYALLNQKTYPSWLYPVTQGATTIWERWDGKKPDGSFQDKGMNSFNHYAYGAIGEWLYRVVAGIEIDPEQPGYKHILIQPQPGGGLKSARASLESPYGKIVSSWNLEGTYFSLIAEVPPNTTAAVTLRDADLSRVLERGKNLSEAEGVQSIEEKDGALLIELGSGVYQFEWNAPNLAAFIRSGEELSTHTKLETLMENETAVEVLRRLLPGLLEHPSIGMAKALSIRQISQFAPDQMTDERLDAVDKALKELEN